MDNKARYSTDSAFPSQPQSEAIIDDALNTLLDKELNFQHTTINLTAACNYLSALVASAMHPALNNIHCEGYPGQRYHEGQTFADEIEQLAVLRAKRLFNADHANVQPYRGTMANVAACIACCQAGDTVLGFACDAGGHFTTGAQIHLVSQLYRVETYSVDPHTRRLDYDAIERCAVESRPALIFAGDTAYPGLWDWSAMRAIANKVGARLAADVSQNGGLIAAGLAESPVGIADVVTMATYKTLRGPRAGLILCNQDLAKKIDRAVFPTCQDGTNIMLMAGLAAALFEAAQPAFADYCTAVLRNAQQLAGELTRHGWSLISGGTDNHACLIDLTRHSLTGKQAALALARTGIICNANQIPNDPRPPAQPSGLRLGTPAVTTLGMGPNEMKTLANLITLTLDTNSDEGILQDVAARAIDLRNRFNAPVLNRDAWHSAEQDSQAHPHSC